jgi:hypothetical protein
MRIYAMKRTVEIEDVLGSCVESAIDKVKDLLEEYIKENDSGSLPDINNDLDYSGSVHEIIDRSVPDYYKVIDDTWYLYKDDLIEAYENSGMGENPMDGNGTVAIYCYIEQKVGEWYRKEAQDIFDEIVSKKKKKKKKS